MKLLLENISFCYHKPLQVLADISISPVPGGITALLGSNGSGKSTMLKIISGIYPPTSGKAEINGISIASMSPHKRAAMIAMIRQQPVQTAYSVAETVAMGCYHRTSRWGSLPETEMKLLNNVLEISGITHLRNRSCDELSGGELQMVMAAQSLMQLPAGGILLADEPASMLDPAKKTAFAKLLRTGAASKTATVVTTHDPAFAARYADMVILLKSGRVIAAGTPAETLTAQKLAAAYDCTPEILATADGLKIPFFL